MKKFISQLVFAFSMIFFSSISNALPPSGPINHHYIYLTSYKSSFKRVVKNGISICHVNEHDGTLILPCTIQQTNGEDRNLEGIYYASSIATIPNSNYAYILAGSQVSLCKINDENGLFTKCKEQSISTRGDLYSIAVDANATVLYIAGHDSYNYYRVGENILYRCGINPHNGSIGECTPNPSSALNINLRSGNMIALSNTTNPPYLYYITAKEIKIRDASGTWGDAIGRYNTEIQYYIASCLRDGANNIHHEGCHYWHPDMIHRPQAIVADPHHWNVYFTGGGSIFSCMIEANGTPYECKEAYDIESLMPNKSDPMLTSIAIAPDGEHIYIGANYKGALYFCTINYHNRTFNKCTIYPNMPNISSLAYK